MRIKKEIQEIKNFLETLTEENQKKLKDYELKKELLENVKLSVKNIATTIDEFGKPVLIVNYEMPTVKVLFDENNDIVLNETFRAINLLNLIDYDDMLKIGEKIDSIKKGGVK